MAGLSIGEVNTAEDAFAWASITGETNYDETSTEGGGWTDFTVYVEERGTAHAGHDRLWVQAGVSNLTSEMWMDAPALVNAIEIQGGNLVVPHSSADPDGDGIVSIDDNCVVISNVSQLDTDADNQGDPCDSDDDGDGLGDAFETANGFDPLSAGEENEDTDGDGLSNLEEFLAGTNPLVIDSDGDGYTDSVEMASNSDPNNPASMPGAPEVPGLPLHLALLAMGICMLAATRLIPQRSQGSNM